LPALSGATLRIFYSFLPSIVGGRRFTAISTASLLIPAIGIGMAVQDPSTPFSIMLILALLCGFGGGNFSSSMSNISFFFPKAQKGTALGLNAGLGNLGVSIMQFLVPVVVTIGVFGALGGEPQTFSKDGVEKSVWLQNAGYIWVPFIVASALAAWFGMNDLASARSSFKEMSTIFKDKHNWLMCWLYIGTFGSFIGFSAGLALVMKVSFPDIDPIKFAFLGPLIGALMRPVGGVLSDKLGGGRVTFWTFILMIISTLMVLQFLPQDGQGGNFNGFLLTFLVLFALTGIGNASTFQMIPVIYQRLHLDWSTKDADQIAAKESAASIGFAGAIGAYGGFFIPKAFGSSIKAYGSPEVALYLFAAFYVSCLLITWWYYSRKGAEMPC
jgi:NNP family nitrate/nitrite transporter-like MFS transporter